ncbi:MAG: electron transfer flavoprotein subunit beta/FixA family protein [Erysipelotrichaceae bacterium]|nr:electron transfer flavoprotein subunit beta/FixA family protein [Erysipelothrix sp.]MCD8574711.1 electron transfer flavoprotein subunit beta/FixA family protein [Erysipelotrichaceae bacterium]
MKIIVLVKQVPNTTQIKVDPVKGTLIRDGVESIINPDDRASVESALRIKDQIPGTHVRVITMGPKQAVGMLKELYGMGVDDCVLVNDPIFAGADTWATSLTLSKAISLYEFDLIIAGRQAIDGDTAQVGPQVAEFLNVPQVTYVARVEDVNESNITVVKSYEDMEEKIRVSFPCLITTLADQIKARLGNFKLVWNSDEKSIPILTATDLKAEPHEVGLRGSLTQVKKTFVKSVSQKGQMIKDDLDLAAKTIADIIHQNNHA